MLSPLLSARARAKWHHAPLQAMEVVPAAPDAIAALQVASEVEAATVVEAESGLERAAEVEVTGVVRVVAEVDVEGTQTADD